MRAILCKEIADPPVLALEEVPPPSLGPGQVRVRLRAAGVNFADTLIVRGKYQGKPDLPFTPGMEAAGEVTGIGEGVTSVAVGDRVIAMLSVGAFAEEAVTGAERILKIPDGMDFETAAGFPVAYGTSHGALAYRAGLKAGEVLLVHGASGGVGLTAVEIGKIMGAIVIATASTPEKLEIARAAGADHLINYTTESIRDRVKELTGGADVVYDPVGGDAFTQSLRCINWEGRLLVIGFASGTIQDIPANYLLVKNCSAVGFFWGAYMQRDPAVVMNSFKTLMGWFSEGKLKPHISHRLPLARAAEALDMLSNRTSTGKVVLTMDGA